MLPSFSSAVLRSFSLLRSFAVLRSFPVIRSVSVLGSFHVPPYFPGLGSFPVPGSLPGLRSFPVLRSLIALSMLALAGCESGTDPDVEDIRDFIAQLATANGQIQATFRSGEAPAAGSGPSVNASGSSAMILGGGTIRTLSSGAPFRRIIVTIDGVDGYWELTLPNDVTTQSIFLVLGQEIPDESFTVGYAGGTSQSLGAYDKEAVSLLEVGTGNIQVNVSWDSDADVDLYLVEPNGNEIYYGSTESSTGGELDLDSNAGCSPGTRNENITYPTGTPPRGTYTVRVNYWSACGATSTQYVVTVRVQGQAPRPFTGSFSGGGNQGGAGAGTIVTTFTF
jgi:hypothetical protein